MGVADAYSQNVLKSPSNSILPGHAVACLQEADMRRVGINLSDGSWKIDVTEPGDGPRRDRRVVISGYKSHDDACRAMDR